MKILLLLSVLSVALIAGCIGQTPAPAGEPIKIGVIAPLSGPNAWIGEFAVPTAQLAAKEVNDAGGVNGRQLQAVVEDAADPKTATTAANKLIGQNNVAALYLVTTPVTAGGAPVADANQVPAMGFTAVAAFAENSQFVFSDLRDIKGECKLLGEAALQENDTRLAFLGNDADFTPKCRESLMENFVAKGGKLVADEVKNSNDPVAATVLTKIADSNPDGLLLICWPPDCNLIYKKMKELGLPFRLYLPVALPLPSNPISLQGLNASEILNDAIGGEQGFDPSVETPELANYKARFKAFAGKEAVHLQDSTVIYDNIRYLAIAMQRCPDLGGVCIRDALLQTNYTGIAGHVEFNGRHFAPRSIRVVHYVNGAWQNYALKG
jgi:branched-chain amino acid transport system substrate-binding protein